MTIKKPMKAPEAADAAVPEMSAPDALPAVDTASFDVPDVQPKKSGGGKSALFAVVAALIGLALAGMLTYTLYQHLEFLKGA